jgi:N4-gp56 family major capsid protein
MFGQVRNIPANSGDTVKFRKFGNLTAATTALTEGITPPGSTLSITDITVTPAQYGDYVTITDRLIFTTLDPVLMETAEILGDQAGETLDIIARDVLVAGTNVIYAGAATSRATVAAAHKIDAVAVNRAVRSLKLQHARRLTNMIDPSNGVGTKAIMAGFVGICHINTTYDLQAIPTFTSVENYPAQRGVMEDEVGAVGQVRFVETANAKIFTAAGVGGIDVYATLIFSENAYGVTRIAGQALRNIVKALGSAGTADPLEQRATSGWKATFAAKRLNEAWLVRIEHSVSA